ncbi:hypothetical protein H0H87_007801 [Tephrocybe sp. NHM501043]|nr:hypothetical protein H0H87_007801 [Tephrocybe sp. NHM501043]
MPVCSGCSLEFCFMKGNSDDLCNKCQQLSGKSVVEKLAIKLEGKLPNMPDSLHHVSGALKQLTQYQSEEAAAANILSSAAVYQSKASNSRLNKPTVHVEPKKIPTRFGKPLTPSQITAQSIRDERKMAKENASKIQIVAALWLTKVNKAGNTIMTKEPKVQFSVSVPEEQEVFDAIGTVIKDAQEFHKQSYPLAQRLTR